MIWTFLIVCIGLVSAYETVHPRRLSELRSAGQHEEFAKLLGIDDVELVRPSNKQRSEFPDMISRPVSHFGDIMLTKEQKEEARHHIQFWEPDLTRYMWPNGSVYYWIHEPNYDWIQRYFIKQAIDEMNGVLAHVKLLPFPETHNVEHFIYFFGGSGDWSYVGRQGGAQPVSVRNDRYVWKDTILRLLLNVFGVYFEQCRCDRDRYIEVHEENIPAEYRPYFQKVNCDVFWNPYPYDFKSIMHFPARVPETGEKAFTVLDDSINEDEIGYAISLSSDDVRKVNDAYRSSDRY